jgi:hypothetical protein
MRPDASTRTIVLAAILLTAIAGTAAQHASSGANTGGRQSQTGSTVTFPSPTRSALAQYVTDARFQITARPDAGGTVLPQEQTSRVLVTMRGDMRFRTGGYRVRTDAQVLERTSTEIRYTIDITSPQGPATQAVTPRTVQEQVTVDTGTYDATVVVTVDGQAVYREQRRLQLGSTGTPDRQPQQRQRSRIQEQAPSPQENAAQQPLTQGQSRQEAERSLQAAPEQQTPGIQQRMRQLEQRIARLERQLQQMRPGGARTAGAGRQQSPQSAIVSGQRAPSSVDAGTTQQMPGQSQQSPGTASRDSSSNTSPDGAASGQQQNMSVAIMTDQPTGREEELAIQEQGPSDGPVRILISIFS